MHPWQHYAEQLHARPLSYLDVLTSQYLQRKGIELPGNPDEARHAWDSAQKDLKNICLSLAKRQISSSRGGQDAEEIAQQVLQKLCRCSNGFVGSEAYESKSVIAFLKTCVKNTWQDFFRHKKTKELPLNSGGGEPGDPENIGSSNTFRMEDQLAARRNLEQLCQNAHADPKLKAAIEWRQLTEEAQLAQCEDYISRLDLNCSQGISAKRKTAVDKEVSRILISYRNKHGLSREG